MIVSNSPELRAATARVLGTLMKDVQIIQADHKNALEMFLEREPERVLIFDYNETGDGREEWNEGKTTYRDIKGAASEQLIIRCGLPDYKYDDYVKLPFLLPELIKILQVRL